MNDCKAMASVAKEAATASVRGDRLAKTLGSAKAIILQNHGILTVGQSVDAAGAFLHDMRRVAGAAELFAVCDRHLLAEPDREFSAEPYPGVIARPNCETPEFTCSL